MWLWLFQLVMQISIFDVAGSPATCRKRPVLPVVLIASGLYASDSSSAAPVICGGASVSDGYGLEPAAVAGLAARCGA
jgi:hypothetical protein